MWFSAGQPNCRDRGAFAHAEPVVATAERSPTMAIRLRRSRAGCYGRRMSSSLPPPIRLRFEGAGTSLTMRVGSRWATAMFAAWLFFGVPGCVRRRMLVRTHPAGAAVSVDNQVIGVSPAATSFTYYGARDLRIEKDGYRTEVIRKNVRPPWYQWPGIDFVAETLWPWEIRDERVIDVQLTPKALSPTEEVINRADTLRSQSQTGMVPNVR